MIITEKNIITIKGCKKKVIYSLTMAPGTTTNSQYPAYSCIICRRKLLASPSLCDTGRDEFFAPAKTSNCSGCNLLELLDLFVTLRKESSLTLYKTYEYWISEVYDELWNLMNASGRWHLNPLIKLSIYHEKRQLNITCFLVWCRRKETTPLM